MSYLKESHRERPRTNPFYKIVEVWIDHIPGGQSWYVDKYIKYTIPRAAEVLHWFSSLLK